MNTRTYPRTLNEAFPRTAAYGAAIERPAPLFARTRWASAAVAVAMCAGLLAIAMLGEPGQAERAEVAQVAQVAEVAP